MSSLTCTLCGRAMDDLEGDVVADRAESDDPNRVGRLRVVCDTCKARPDTAERFQTMWGLAWLRGHYLGVTRSLLVDGTDATSDRSLLAARRRRTSSALGYFLLPGQHPPGEDQAGG